MQEKYLENTVTNRRIKEKISHHLEVGGFKYTTMLPIWNGKTSVSLNNVTKTLNKDL